jgi:hypothetical protein
VGTHPRPEKRIGRRDGKPRGTSAGHLVKASRICFLLIAGIAEFAEIA